MSPSLLRTPNPIPTELTRLELRMEELRLSRLRGAGGGKRGDGWLYRCVLLNVLAVGMAGVLRVWPWFWIRVFKDADEDDEDEVYGEVRAFPFSCMEAISRFSAVSGDKVELDETDRASILE